MKRKWKLCFGFVITFVFLLILFALPASAAQTQGIISGQWYTFLNMSDNYAVDVTGGSTAPGASITRYPHYSTTPWQQWRVDYVPEQDAYTITDMHSWFLLSIPGSSGENNLATWTYPEDKTAGQYFRLQKNSDGSYTFLTKASNYQKALGWNGQALTQMTADGTANQRFRFVIAGCVYYFRNAGTGNNIDSGDSVANGASVAQFTATDGRPWQQWKINHIGNGVYTIMDMYSGLYLSIMGSSAENNTGAWKYVWDGTAGQKFRIQANDDGTVTFFTVCGEVNNMVLTLPLNEGNTHSLVQRPYDGSDTQKFHLEYAQQSEMPEGHCFFMNSVTEKYMQKDNNGGEFLEQHDFEGLFSQMWDVQYAADGYFTIVHKESHLYLTQPNNTTAGQKLLLSASLPYDPPNGYIDGQRQRWKISIKERGFVEMQSRYHSLNAPDLVVAVGSEIGINNGTNIEQRLRTNANGKYLWRITRSTGTPLLGQDAVNSCWLAAAEMNTETYGYNSYTQYQVAQKMFPEISNILEWNFGSYSGNPYKRADACRIFTDKDQEYAAYYFQIYNEEQLRFFISLGHPVAISKGWYKNGVRDGGHATIITGYYYDYARWIYRYVEHDPWQTGGILPGDGSIAIRSYNNLLNANTQMGGDPIDSGRWESVSILIFSDRGEHTQGLLRNDQLPSEEE